MSARSRLMHLGQLLPFVYYSTDILGVRLKENASASVNTRWESHLTPLFGRSVIGAKII